MCSVLVPTISISNNYRHKQLAILITFPPLYSLSIWHRFELNCQGRQRWQQKQYNFLHIILSSLLTGQPSKTIY